MVESTDRDLVLRTRRGGSIRGGRRTVSTDGFQRMLSNVRRTNGGRGSGKQDTFIRAFERLETFDVERPFGPWIRRVANNVCLNHIQKQKPESYELDEERDQSPAAAGQEPESHLQSAQAGDEVRSAILKLPPRYRSVIELQHYQEMSYSEIAEALELPISDVKSHLYRARKRLGAVLSADE